MNFPDNLKYTSDHEWVSVDGNVATIGITDHAQGELGDIVYLDFKEPDTVAQGDSVGTIEAVKTVADLFSPITGKVLEVNSGLNDAPETANTDPYGAGWMVKIEMTNPDELNALMGVAEYKASVGH